MKMMKLNEWNISVCQIKWNKNAATEQKLHVDQIEQRQTNWLLAFFVQTSVWVKIVKDFISKLLIK